MDKNANQKVTCVANYAYEAVEPDELSLRVGDVVRQVERLAGGWWRGELRGRTGMFPDNFVTPLTDHGTLRPGGVQGRCRAVFSYQPANPDELPLSVGDVLEVLGEVEEGWWQGRRQGRVGVFPSNFVVMLDQPAKEPAAAPAPALPPKPVKELCRVLFPYTAVNEDELTLAEGDVVTIVSKEAPDRGWWRGELRGRVGLFPDNFVQVIAGVAQDAEEKKPDRPPSAKTIYAILNKHSEKTASKKELTTTKISMHKENSLSKENSTQSTITHTSKGESEKLIHNETVSDGTLDGQVKKPPVPTKKSPTPATGVGGLFSGLKSKMLSSDKERDKSSPPATAASSGSSSGGEWDRPDGGAASKPGNTLDAVERNSILNDPRAGRVKAPRRRPPSQAFRDDTPQQIGLSNGHEVPADQPPPEKGEVKPRAREWEKHKAPWMEELKLNQAKKTTGDGKPRSTSSSSEGAGVASKAGGGSTDRILEVGLEEKRSTHSMEMSKSTSSISNRISVVESIEESVKTRQSLESKKDAAPPLPATEPPKTAVHSPTAAGRTFTTMLDELNKPPPPPSASVRTHGEHNTNSDKSPSKTVISTEKHSEFVKHTGSVIDRSSASERIERMEERSERPVSAQSNAVERRLHGPRGPTTAGDHGDELIAQLNSRILNLEKLLEVQNAKFSAAIEELTARLAAETRQREALQAELNKLAHCVTQV